MRPLKGFERKALIVGGSLLFLVLIFSLLKAADDEMAVVRNLEDIAIFLLIGRLLVIGSCWYFWDSIIDWYFDGKAQAAAEHLKGRRTTFILLFLIIELLLVQNVLGELWLLVS